jgi:hypothetical protein
MPSVKSLRAGMKNQRDWHTYIRALRLREASAEPYLCMRAKARPFRRPPSVRFGAWSGNASATMFAGSRARIHHCSTICRAGAR